MTLNKNKRILQHQNLKQVKMYFFVCFLWITYISAQYYSYAARKLKFSHMQWEIKLLKKASTRVIEKKIKSSSKEYLVGMNFKLWPMEKFSENCKPVRVFVYKITELLSFMTFCVVHLKSKEVCYLPWQNKYSNFNTACHSKPKCFL